MKRYLVTGCFGFIGQYLCKGLIAKGGVVKGIGHKNSGDLLIAENEMLQFYNATLNSTSLQDMYGSKGDYPDVIFHLAGGSSVGVAIENPKRDFDRTVGSTLSLLEWIRLECPNTLLIVISSAAVYGAQYSAPINELDSVSPYSPYGYNKYIMETLCRSYVDNYGLKVKVARVFSVYGEHLKKQLLWDLCKKLEQSPTGPIELGGTGGEKRDWIHVDDVVSCVIKLSECSDTTLSLVNVASGHVSSVKEIALIVLNAWHGKGNNCCNIVFNGKVRKGDPFSLIADVNLMKDSLGVTCKALEVGLCNYVEWFKAVHEIK